MAERHRDMEFILYGREGDVLVEVVVNFKYLGRPLDQKNDDWTEVQRKINRLRRVWGSLGKMPQREGVDSKVVAMFYRAVVQAVLLFGPESWVLLEAVGRMVEGTHTGFMRKIMGKRARRKV